MIEGEQTIKRQYCTKLAFSLLTGIFCFLVGGVFYAMIGRNFSSRPIEVLFGIVFPYAGMIWVLRRFELEDQTKEAAWGGQFFWVGIVSVVAFLFLPFKMSPSEVDTIGKLKNYELLVYLSFVCALTPYLEEWLLRGLIFRQINVIFGLSYATAISIGLTAITHNIYSEKSLLPLLITTSLFTFVYYKTGSYKQSAVVHSIYNFGWYLLAIYR
jgi:membrane protease YdiL (CAAX protease family)